MQNTKNNFIPAELILTDEEESAKAAELEKERADPPTKEEAMTRLRKLIEAKDKK